MIILDHFRLDHMRFRKKDLIQIGELDLMFPDLCYLELCHAQRPDCSVNDSFTLDQFPQLNAFLHCFLSALDHKSDHFSLSLLENAKQVVETV